MIDLNLVKQATDLGDWILSLPTKLVESVIAPRLVHMKGKLELDRLAELAALSEAGQRLTYLYLFKGNVYQWANRLQHQQQVDGAEYVRDIFKQASATLDEVENILTGNSLSSFELATSAARRLADAKMTFASLAELSNADIFEDRGLIDIIAAMDHLMASGDFLMRMADGHRRELESKGAPPPPPPRT